MIRALVPLLLIFSFSLMAQEEGEWEPPAHQPRLLIKTYPIRYVYGPNAEITYVHEADQQITFMYQYHHRDFFSIHADNDMLGFSLIPRLLSGGGYTAYLSYLFKVGQGNFYIGPKLGYKNVFGQPRDSTAFTDGWPDFVHQENAYALFNMVLRNQNEGFIFEGYMQIGAVGIKREHYMFENAELILEEDLRAFVVPHILIGFSVGLGI